jgi:tetratricopeptide (TPR) repeat protein
MRRVLTLTALLAVAAGVVVGVACLHRDPSPWSTDSPEALAAFRAGEQSMSKLYSGEAAQHFAEALAYDPDFALAKLMLVLYRSHLPDGPERAARLIEELRGTDLSALKPRERLLISYYLARIDHDGPRAADLLTDYLDGHPDDPYAVELRCGEYWGDARWDDAKACYQRLINLDPNRVEAQNRIGYISMAQGDFADAEEQFEIYRYLDPDQANPYDSMGELMMLTGRYDEAETQLRQAVELRPDFCPSWVNLVQIELLRRDPDAALEVIDEARATDQCPKNDLDARACEVEIWRAAQDGRWDDAWQTASACGAEAGGPLSYLAALFSGHRDEAEKIAARVHERAEEYGDEASLVHAVDDHQTAVAALYAGDPARAVEKARQADRRLLYWSGQGLMKLLNRALLAEALRAAGRDDEAAAVVEEIRAVNPHLVERPPFPLPQPPAVASASTTPAATP